MNKISVVGAGRVGETTAQILAQQHMADEVAILDVRKGAAAGSALDICQSAAYFGFDTRVTGGTDAALLAGSDLVIITAGSPRKPGMSRSDVLDVNRKVIDSIVDDVLKYAPDSMLLLVSNPVDVLTWEAWQRTGWDRHRVFGQAGVLDTSRMASFVAEETGLSVQDVHAMVIGGHGDLMVPLTRFSTINGVPASGFLDATAIARINKRTRHGGAEVLKLRQISSAYIAPAAAVATMVDSIVHNRRRVLPCVCVLDGEYGQSNITGGVPAIVGRKGIEKVVELPLSEEEKTGFQASIDSIAADIKTL
ncbi:MAG TPA: malate dehydrogenase [Gammaproteobacteria bacterium]|jgi:malate dehydrogenase|nr:malate dehydrogenase [Gammaproteobacteria bacterium]